MTEGFFAGYRKFLENSMKHPLVCTQTDTQHKRLLPTSFIFIEHSVVGYQKANIMIQTHRRLFTSLFNGDEDDVESLFCALVTEVKLVPRGVMKRTFAKRFYSRKQQNNL